MAFFIAGKIIIIEFQLLNIGGNLEKKNNIILNKINSSSTYCFFLATEIVDALKSIGGKLSQMETEMRHLIILERSDVKNSVILEALQPVLAVAQKIIPYMDGLKEKQQLLEDTRTAFESRALAPRID